MSLPLTSCPLVLPVHRPAEHANGQVAHAAGRHALDGPGSQAQVKGRVVGFSSFRGRLGGGLQSAQANRVIPLVHETAGSAAPVFPGRRPPRKPSSMLCWAAPPGRNLPPDTTPPATRAVQLLFRGNPTDRLTASTSRPVRPATSRSRVVFSQLAAAPICRGGSAGDSTWQFQGRPPGGATPQAKAVGAAAIERPRARVAAVTIIRFCMVIIPSRWGKFVKHRISGHGETAMVL